jgi:hypothetical protein
MLKRDRLPSDKSLHNQENRWGDSHYGGLRSLRSKSFEPVHFEFSFVNILSTVKGLDNHRTEFSSIGNHVHQIAIRQNRNAAGQDINASSCNASRIIQVHRIDARSTQKQSTVTDRKAQRQDWHSLVISCPSCASGLPAWTLVALALVALG